MFQLSFDFIAEFTYHRMPLLPRSPLVHDLGKQESKRSKHAGVLLFWASCKSYVLVLEPSLFVFQSWEMSLWL